MYEISLSEFNEITKKVIPQKVTVYDSTLRDGEQMPGVTFSKEQKVAIAGKLAETGVKQIEAGFPAVSEGEFESVKAVVDEGLDAEILALSRIRKEDIDAAADCGIDMILLFIASSDIHMKFKNKCEPEELLEKTRKAVEYAKDRGFKVSFSTEDSTRTSLSFLKQIYSVADGAGAERLGITDTVGCITPDALGYLVKEIKATTRKDVSVHLHNDFGLALANALTGIENGADAVTTTVNGIGERAGNLALDEFVMACTMFYDAELGIDTTKLKELSDMVADLSGVGIPENKPWVGGNVFSHESGIHVAAVLNCPATYECVSPRIVGQKRHLILGKHSGTTIIKRRLGENNIELSQEQICNIVRDVKRLGERKGRVSDREFWGIVEKHRG